MGNRQIRIATMTAAMVAAAVLASHPGAVSAQPMAQGMEHAAPDCAVVKVALPPELAGWSARVPATAAKDKAGLARAAFPIGRAVDAALTPTAELRYVLRPEKPGGSVSYGGLFGLSIVTAGTYRVALGAGAWIDMVKGGKAIASTGHGHGPDCSGIRKMVDFPLTPGRYVLQLAANGAQSLPVMVTRLP